MNMVPLVVVFVAPSMLRREADRASDLPIVRNGPPGTFVVIPDARVRLSLPTDQILAADDAAGGVRVTFGGMRFTGEENGTLTFVRAREIYPEDQLSPERSHIMRLDRRWVTHVLEDARVVWPR